LERTQSPNHPLVISKRIELEELNKKIGQMNLPTGKQASSEMKLLVPFSKIPDLGAEYMRRFRDVEMQYKILQFITPLFEQAKVEEQRQTPSVLVLDQAFPAERKSKPKRLWIVLGGLFVGFFGSIAYIGIATRWNREKSANSRLYQAASGMIVGFAGDLSRIWHRRTRTAARQEINNE